MFSIIDDGETTGVACAEGGGRRSIEGHARQSFCLSIEGHAPKAAKSGASPVYARITGFLQ